ncbi:MAG: arsenite methyltransferase [Chloroflexi bacterium]|nr:arsenite methyltransferase [Chloroflexota bacterium]
MEEKNIKKIVRDGYAGIAKQTSSCCGPAKSCCGSGDVVDNQGRKIGYTEIDLSNIPEGANLGLGCGNPVALASIKEGEVVLDLGSGAGIDCFLAAKKVGEKGKVIGVDMTPEMLDRARENVRKSTYKNIEFRLGEIENLPVADNSVDLIISNCVINLSTDKRRVFEEAFRVLKPSGRIMVSDIVILKDLPANIKESVAAYVGCVAGAINKNEYIKNIKETGFREVKIVDETYYPLDYITDNPVIHITPEQARDITKSIASIKVSGVKPSF